MRVTRSRSLGVAVSLVVVGLLVAVAVPPAYALYGNELYERPSSGYEGTYEWRGVMAHTWVYDWGNSGTVFHPDGIHVSSVYIRHPLAPTNTRHMECGIAKDRAWKGEQPFFFYQYCRESDSLAKRRTIFVQYVPTGTYQKLVIRNMTMGTADDIDERWIMSLNDVIRADILHPLTYGQAIESAESKYVGDDNRAFFTESKRTSKPANWKYWTASRERLMRDSSHYISKSSETQWTHRPK